MANKPAGMSWAEWVASQPVQYTNTWQQGIGNAAKEIGYTGDIYSPEYRQAQSQFYSGPPSHDGGGADISSLLVSYNPELLKLLEGYRFNSADVGRHKGVSVSDASGQSVGTFKTGDTGSSFDDFAFKAVPMGIAALAGATFGGLIPGAEIGAGAGGGGGLIGAGEGASQLAAYTAANPLTASEVMATTLPSGGLPGLGTAGGFSGLLQAGGQAASDAIGAVKSAGAPAFQFLKDNPTLGRLLLGGATSLLSAQGGGSSGGSEAPSGPPVQWNSPIQQGLLAPAQQYAPAAIQQNKPAGLLAQGNTGAGAWRFLGG